MNLDMQQEAVSKPHGVVVGGGYGGVMAANRLGPLAAETVFARLAGASPEPISIGFVGQCISLGRALGPVAFVRRSDSAVAARLRGMPAATVKELVCRGTVRP